MQVAKYYSQGLLFVLKTLLLALTLTFCAEQIENVKTINRLVIKYFILIMIIFFQIYNYFIQNVKFLILV
jgi:hypothetical protein